MNDLIDFADIGPIPEPTIWTKPPLDLDALEAKITGLTPQWPLPGPAEKAMRSLIEEVRKLRAEPAVLKDALTNSCDLLEHYIDTFGDMSGANRADVNDYRAVLSLADERGL